MLFPKKSQIACTIRKKFEIYFSRSINSPDPSDHLPMLEASEIPVEML